MRFKPSGVFRLRVLLWAAALLLACTPLSAAKWAGRSKEKKTPEKSGYLDQLMIVPAEGKRVRDITVRSLESGDMVRLSDLRGKVVLLNFWATWCGPCRMEVQDLEQLHRALPSEDFAIMAVDIQEKAGRVREFMGREKLTFPVYLDSEGSAALAWQVSGIPTTFVIDPDGDLVGTAVGPREWGGDASMSLMRSLAK